jgi:hypothetical protein
MSLTLSSSPAFAELIGSTFDAGAVPTAAEFQALNRDAKFAAVRNEQFWGYYANGHTVALPVSPADGYTYSRAELFYEASVVYTGAPGTFTAGTHTLPTGLFGLPPAGHATSQPTAGVLLQLSTWTVDQATGLVAVGTSYWDGSTQTVSGDGIVMVMVHAQRSR